MKLFIDNSFVLRKYYNALNALKDIYNGADNDEQRKLYRQLADENFNFESLTKHPKKLLGDTVWDKVQRYREELLLHDFAAFRLNVHQTKLSDNGRDNVKMALNKIKGLHWKLLPEEQSGGIYGRQYVGKKQKSQYWEDDILETFIQINEIHGNPRLSVKNPEDKLIEGTSLELITAGYPNWSNDDMAFLDYDIDYSDKGNKVKLNCIQYLDKYVGYKQKKILVFPIPFSPVCI